MFKFSVFDGSWNLVEILFGSVECWVSLRFEVFCNYAFCFFYVLVFDCGEESVEKNCDEM